MSGDPAVKCGRNSTVSLLCGPERSFRESGDKNQRVQLDFFRSNNISQQKSRLSLWITINDCLNWMVQSFCSVTDEDIILINWMKIPTQYQLYIGSPAKAAQKTPDSRPNCVVAMIPAQADQQVAVGTKSGPPGPSEDLWALLGAPGEH